MIGADISWHQRSCCQELEFDFPRRICPTQYLGTLVNHSKSLSTPMPEGSRRNDLCRPGRRSNCPSSKPRGSPSRCWLRKWLFFSLTGKSVYTVKVHWDRCDFSTSPNRKTGITCFWTSRRKLKGYALRRFKWTGGFRVVHEHLDIYGQLLPTS